MSNKQSIKEKVKFNLNSNIYVKLTKKGIELYNKRFEKYGREPARKLNTKEYTRFQAWEFMEIFGPITQIGMQLFYELTVLIDKEDIE